MKPVIVSRAAYTILAVVFILLSLLLPADSARHLHRHKAFDGDEVRSQKVAGADTLQIAGSTLPDCSHACGSCTPCRLVMVSFACSSLEEAETCPMAYKCMCNNKSYPVP